MRMAVYEISGTRKASCIDKQLLQIKLHYFLAFGALGGVLPYLPVLAKSLNIHATAVGIMYTAIPFIVLLAKPLFGIISDHFKNIKKVMVCVLFCILLAYSLILAIPPIQPRHQEDFALIKCRDSRSNATLPVHYDPACLLDKLSQGTVCRIVGQCPSAPSDHTCDNNDFNVFASFNETANVGLVVCRDLNETYFEGNVSVILQASKNSSSSSTCVCLTENHLSINCTPSFESCAVHAEKEDPSEVYRSFQFWTFLLLVMVGNTGSGVLFSLTDTACYAILGGRANLYGRQRLFGTLSWGAIAFLAGYFNDMASANFGETNYSPGFYLMLIMAGFDLLLLWKGMDLKQNTSSQSIWKDIGSLFSSCRVVAFAIGVVITGGLCGTLWNYQFWYLQTLGASQLLLGLTITVQCLAAEVPFFFFSGYIIERLGHSLCLILTFVAFALRYFLYSLLTNPWYTLPIEVLHGWTFGVFFATMTSYGSQFAPPGTEATMQGVLGGLFEGLGVAIGSLLSGVGFDQLGGRHTFLTAAIISACSSVAFSIVTAVLKRQEKSR